MTADELLAKSARMEAEARRLGAPSLIDVLQALTPQQRRDWLAAKPTEELAPKEDA